MTLAQLMLVIATMWAADSSNERDGIEFFEKKIRPVLVAKCYECHSQQAIRSKKLKANLLLDSKSGVLAGGESGQAIVPGKPTESLLMEAIRHQSLQMPPNEKLDDYVIADFARWIELGAPDPRAAAMIDRNALNLEVGREHWAFQPLRKVERPIVEQASVRSTIDQFVVAKLLAKQMTPSVEANRRTLIRRVYFDLVGLPPTPSEVEEFVSDNSAVAYENLIDRLLASPRYGERWARHWLDVARFGESEGSNPEEDKLRRNAYRYRDAVIKAFNEDLPFDQFVAHQLAGENETNQSFTRDLSQFIQLGTRLQRNSHPNDKKFHVLDDMISATGSAFLGLSIACARCHDHKLDPITSEEYYELTAVFFDLAKVSDKVGVNRVNLLREPHLLAAGSWQRPVKKVEPGFVRVLMRGQGDAEQPIEIGEENSLRSLVRWITGRRAWRRQLVGSRDCESSLATSFRSWNRRYT